MLAAALLAGAATGQTIVTIAGATPAGGQPVRGFSGDGGPATSAQLALANVQTVCEPRKLNGIFAFDEIAHLSVDRSGNVFIADSANQRIRKVTPQGIITTIAGNGEIPPINERCESIGNAKDIGDGGPATAARLYQPADVLAHPNGSLIIADQQNNRIRQIAPNGVISTIAGNGAHNPFSPGIPATSSPMDWPCALALDPNGVLHFAEIHTHRIGKILPDGRLAAVAGTGFAGYNGDNQPAARAQLYAPAGIAFDASGNLYIADQGNNRVRKVTPDGIISTIAGNGITGFFGDGGKAEETSLFNPNDVKAAASGNLYIADMANNRVRRVSPSGIITTVAGSGRLGRGPDGVPATSSSLSLPSGIAFDPNGDLYILDWQNYVVRKVYFDPRPALFAGGIVNGASFAPAPVPVAPGSIISLFGVNLASAARQASELPLPVQLGETTVTVNGAPIPVFFVSPLQVNAQLPFETPPGPAATVVSNAAGAGKPETFNVAPAAVGVFQFPGGSRAIVLNQDGSVNGPNNPESRGNVIVAFLTGQGSVDPPVATGQAAPLDPLSRAVLPVAASIGGLPAEVLFLGLTPGFAGLAQANIQIATGVTPGSAVTLVISVGGQPGNAAAIAVK